MASSSSPHTTPTNDAFNALLGTWTGPAIGLLDLDCFFASVEALDHPQWRGKPIIVGGPSSQRGVVSTANYEARKFGVHSAMASVQAEQLCPDAIWVSPHMKRYQELSAQVMDIISQETPYVDQVSIDEAFFDITPGRYSREHPIQIIERISTNVQALGITCSIGLGCNKTIAKIASEAEKPCGLTVVPPGTEEQFLAPLPVNAISGIGAKATAALNARGIRTIKALAHMSISSLEPIFGVNAQMILERAQGLEVSRVGSYCEHEPAKSISQERTFAKDLIAQDDIEAAIKNLAQNVAAQLRSKKLLGSTVHLKLHYSYKSHRSSQRKLNHPTDDEYVLIPTLLDLLTEIWSPGMSIRLIGVGVSGFNDTQAYQTDLFCQLDERGAQVTKQRDLSVAMDTIKERFGSDSVTFGRENRI